MEVARIFFKVPGRNVFLIGMLVMGLIAHSIFLVNQFTLTAMDGERPQLLANWFQWAVLGAWGLALSCTLLTIRNPNGSMGLFLIPMVLILIGLAQFMVSAPAFELDTTVNLWRAIHGVSLLVGTMFIVFGLAFGLMYLFQSHRLKLRSQKRSRIKLPTLEFLQSMNRLSLLASALGVAVGLLSGVMMNFNQQGHVAWLSGETVFTFALFVWVTIAALLEMTTGSSLGGRRSAYLVIANFIFLVVVMTSVLFSSHGQPSKPAQPTSQFEADSLPYREVG